MTDLTLCCRQGLFGLQKPAAIFPTVLLPFLVLTENNFGKEGWLTKRTHIIFDTVVVQYWFGRNVS